MMRQALILLCIVSFFAASCWDHKKVAFNGFVVRKYDTSDTSFGNIVIVNFSYGDTYLLRTTNNYSHLYDSVEVGDTLLKVRNSDSVVLKGVKRHGVYAYPYVFL